MRAVLRLAILASALVSIAYAKPSGGVKLAASDDQPQPSATPSRAALVFEDGFEGAPLDGWVLDSWRQNKAAGRVTDRVAHTGKQALELSSKEPDDIRYYRKVTIDPYGRYRLSAWVKTDDVKFAQPDAKVGANLCLYVVGSPYNVSDSVIGTTDWKRLEFVFNAATRREVTACLRLGNIGSTNTGTAWFDDVQLERLDQPAKPVQPLVNANPTTPKDFPYLGYWQDDLGRVLILRPDGTATYGYAESLQTMKWSLTRIAGKSEMSVPLDFVRFHTMDLGRAMDPANPGNTFLSCSISRLGDDRLILARGEGNIISFGLNKSTQAKVEALISEAARRSKGLEHHPLLGQWSGPQGSQKQFTPGLVAAPFRDQGVPVTNTLPWYEDPDLKNVIYIKTGRNTGKHYTWAFGTAKDNLILRHLNKPENRYTGDFEIYRRAGSSVPSGPRNAKLVGSWGTRFITYRFGADGKVTIRSSISGMALDGQWRGIGTDMIDIRFPTRLADEDYLVEYAWQIVANGKSLRLTPKFPKAEAPTEYERQ